MHGLDTTEEEEGGGTDHPGPHRPCVCRKKEERGPGRHQGAGLESPAFLAGPGVWRQHWSVMAQGQTPWLPSQPYSGW